MEIITERLLLREITWNDLEDIHRLHSIPEVDEFNTLGIPENLDETRELIRPEIESKKADPQNSYTWRIILKNTGDFIGLAGMTLFRDKFRLGEMYYKLLPAFWGKGYATEVTKNLIVVGFDKFGLHKVEAGVATENERSIHVLEKAGMIREGLRRKILPIRGEWKDNYHYAIVEDDPRDY
ncbi:MAG: GNAT family N-acetyltransferase [Bacteroidales bacterium]|nr:GNAT family N-acetyltransferase [Bacteroidales bacterium]